MQKDYLQRFIFDNADVRGAIVSLEQGYADMLKVRACDGGQQQLLAEFAAAAVLLVGHLKFEGLLSLQARGGAGIDLIIAECNEALEYRGVVRGDRAVAGCGFAELFAGGTLAITLRPRHGQQYQGIVPLQEDGLGNCLAEYFRQSEQLPTWFLFAVSARRVTGMMLQALPPQVCLDADEAREHWSRLVHLASTLTPEEMTSLEHHDILYRLYHEEEVRLFEPEYAKWQCSCSVERMERSLLALGEHELLDIIAEHGHIHTQCHFCGKEYDFSELEISQLIQGAGSQNSH